MGGVQKGATNNKIELLVHRPAETHVEQKRRKQEKFVSLGAFRAKEPVS